MEEEQERFLVEIPSPQDWLQLLQRDHDDQEPSQKYCQFCNKKDLLPLLIAAEVFVVGNVVGGVDFVVAVLVVVEESAISDLVYR